MLPGGHRAIGALAVLLVLLLGATLLFPLVSAQTFKVTGKVANCTAGFVPEATVTLTDVNGVRPSRTDLTDPGGVYEFDNPPTGSYSVSASKDGFFRSLESAPVRFDRTRTVEPPDICMVPHEGPATVLSVKVTGTFGLVVPGARVTAFHTLPGRLQDVTSATTDAKGIANLTLWPSTFLIRASAPTLQTVDASVNVAVTNTTTISLVAPVRLFAHVRSTEGFLGEGVVAWLYDTSRANTSEFRMIPATVKASLFEFETVRVTDGTYTIIVDAKGHLAHVGSVTFPGAPSNYLGGNVFLTPAPERYDTTVLYGRQDWNNLTIWRNLTLNADSTLPGLLPPNLRDLRRQIDATFGSPSNGLLDASEITAFQGWLQAKGPAYVTTDEFLTTNGMAYNSSGASFSVSVAGLAPDPSPHGPVWINGSATYGLKKPPPFITPGAKTYFLNMTLVADTNVTTHQNFTYTFALPRLPSTYERNVTMLTPSVSAILTGFNRFTVDPKVSSATTVDARTTVSTVANGTVRAAVIAPTGKFHVRNATFTNYSALVAKDTELTLSAADSSDPNGDARENNFTWDLKVPGGIRWGVEPKFTYTVNGTFLVSITMREGDGSHITTRNITLIVDDTPPVASIRTDRTGSGSANGRTLRVDEDIVIQFAGTLSTDHTFPPFTGATQGVILNIGYEWDFDGDKRIDGTGRTVTHAFDKPGSYTVNLTVTDSVGLKSRNATMTALVNDTTAPSIDFVILDPANDWVTVQSPVERKAIALDASRTTDNLDADATLNFTWTIPGLISVGGVQRSGQNHTLYGINVTFTWTEFNQSHAVRLMVHDTGYRGDGPRKPNFGNLSRSVQVSIDPDLHPDLRIDSGSFKVEPSDPEEGAPVTVTVNVTNKATRTTSQTTASNVQVVLTATSGAGTTGVPAEVRWFKNNLETSDHTIPTGTTVMLVLTARLSGVGNKTLRVFVYDTVEPWTWQTSENRASSSVNVRQPAWQPFVILGAIIALIALAIFGMYARRKIKAGEWRPIRGRRGERAAEEKPRREVKEEKKRL